MTNPLDLHDEHEFPPMVGWFDPTTLVKIARKAINSAMFGQYADRRLLHAALDPATPEKLASRYDLRKELAPGNDGAIWADYVADLGDGFDSTYAIAYLLSRKTLKVEGAGTLPRGQLLIMGGDQVYPDASRDDYEKRMKRPYRFAFPDSDKPDASHPLLFLIPGNHDWYDGLTLFLANFCRGRETKLGSWRSSQHRSYFALRLPHNWWIWAYDSQLNEDIDAPQAAYFVNVAQKAMKRGAPKVILCAPTPTWLKADLKAESAEEREKYYRALNYIAYDVLKVNCPQARVCAVLSGDLHHYSRYTADPLGTQFITAGGGGAFLHPTHHLEDMIEASWVRTSQTLSLTTAPGPEHEKVEQEACYPSKEESRNLAVGNKAFSRLNKTFCWALGAIYWLSALLLGLWGNEVLYQPHAGSWRWAADIVMATLLNPVFWIVAAAFYFALWQYAEGKTKRDRHRFAAIHTAGHSFAFLVLVSLFPPINGLVATAVDFQFWQWLWQPGSIGNFALFAGEMIVAGRFASGLIWGRYLHHASSKHALHANDGFSSMRIDGFRHFLRMRIKQNELTIFPVGLDKSPARCDWKVSNWPPEKDNQDRPVVEPKKPLNPHLIESAPVVIRVPKVQRMTELVK